MKSKSKSHQPGASTPIIPSTSPTAADETAQQAFLWHTQDYLGNYARFADTKAAFAATLAGALIGALFSAKLLTPLGHEHWRMWPLPVWLALAGSIALTMSILFAVRAVYPRLKSTNAQGYIFWGNIAAFTSVAQLTTSFEAQTTKTLNAQLLRQNHDVSKYVCIPKYRNVSWCIIALLVGGLLTAGALLTQPTVSAVSVPTCTAITAQAINESQYGRIL